MLNYTPNLKTPSRTLRKNMTAAEQTLWWRIRGKQLLGVQFYRQKPIGPYIVDFYGPAAHLVIEVDGSQHLEDEHLQKDDARDQCLADEGLLVLRFDNFQVLRETDAVVEKIVGVMEGRLGKSPPAPLFQRGECLEG